MPGYVPAFAADGPIGTKYDLDLRFYADPFVFAAPETNNTNTKISDLCDWLEDYGWIKNGGSYATTSMRADKVPSYNTPRSAPVVGNTFGYTNWPFPSLYLGTYFGVMYKFWNPLSSDPDPTGDTYSPGVLIRSVSLGIYMNDTLDNFIEALEDETGGDWTIDPFPEANAGNNYRTTANFHATQVGMNSNVDNQSPAHTWAPSNSYIHAAFPSNGGFYMFCTAVVRQVSPLIQDSIRMHIYNNLQQTYISFQFNDNPAYQTTTPYILSRLNYMVIASPHQIAFQKYPYVEEDFRDWVDGASVIASALFIPDDFKLRNIAIVNVEDPFDEPIVVETDVPHFLNPGARIRITGVVGGPYNINDKWYVKAVQSQVTFTVSRIRWDPEETGFGIPYIEGGIVTTGIEHSVFEAGDAERAPYQQSNPKVASNGMMLINDEFKRAPAFTYNFPMINVGVAKIPLRTTAHKTLIQAPMIQASMTAGTEGRIVGCLWNCFIELQRQDRFKKAYYKNNEMIVWNRDDTSRANQLLDYTLWLGVS